MKGDRICWQNSIPRPLSPTPRFAGVIMYFPPGRALEMKWNRKTILASGEKVTDVATS